MDLPQNIRVHLPHATLLINSLYRRAVGLKATDILTREGHQFSSLSEASFETGNGAFIVATVEQVDTVGKVAYLAVRGTYEPSDWFNANLLAFPKITSSGVFHLGFEQRARLTPIAFLQDLANEGYVVVCVGHSLGGAAASIIAHRLLLSSALPNSPPLQSKTICISFGAPLVAIGPTTNWMRNENFFHILHADDIVPKALTLLCDMSHRFATSCEDFVKNQLQTEFDKFLPTVKTFLQTFLGVDILNFAGNLKSLIKGSKEVISLLRPQFLALTDYRPFGTFYFVTPRKPTTTITHEYVIKHLKLSVEQVTQNALEVHGFHLYVESVQPTHLVNPSHDSPPLPKCAKPEVLLITSRVTASNTHTDLLVQGKNLSGIKSITLTVTQHTAVIGCNVVSSNSSIDIL